MGRVGRTAAFAILLFLGAAFILRSFRIKGIPVVTLSWEEGKASVVNPGRGFYVQLDTGDYNLIEDYYNGEESFRMVLLALDLSKEEKKDRISEEKLSELKKALSECKRVGMAAIVRAAYQFGDEEYEEPESFDRVLGHAGQVAEVINEYEDIVAAVQAGFIGPFGEWHSSIYVEKDKDDVPYRVKLLEVLLDTLEEGIPVNIRRPAFIREALEYGLDTGRLGIHNDALLSTWSDMGTYGVEGYDREAELAWVQENVKTQMNGGEMPSVSQYTRIKNAVKEFRALNITYLNRYYNTEVLQEWGKTTYLGWNGLDYIREHLGYRLYLDRAVLPESWKPGETLRPSIRIKNTGFAEPEEELKTYVSIKWEDKSFSLSEGRELLEEESPGQFELGVKAGEEGRIQLANDELEFSDGTTWFAVYNYDEKSKRYILER